MIADGERFDRNARLFGQEGQRKLQSIRLGIVGCGGLGSFGGLESAYLGVRDFVLIDPDIVTPSSLNRLVGAGPSDVFMKATKVDVSTRVIRTVVPDATIVALAEPFESDSARAALVGCHLVLACLDDDVERLRLATLLAELAIPSFDLATDVSADGQTYGGRVVFAEPGRRCVSCLGELDDHAMRLAALSPEQRRAHDDIYGLDRDALGTAGAAVVSLNGVIASLAITELMAYVTRLRPPTLTLRYLAHQGQVRPGRTEPTGPCSICGRTATDSAA